MTDDIEPELAEPVKIHADKAGGAQDLIPFDLTVFRESKCLWAANYFILWPIGLTLTWSEAGLDVREWSYPEGERIETINQVPEENQADFEAWLAFVRERLLAMKVEERHSALKHLERHSITAGDQLISAAP